MKIVVSGTRPLQIHRQFVSRGFVMFMSDRGLTLLCHGSEDGRLNVSQTLVDVADAIVCCYPNAVRRVTSGKAVGGWAGSTMIFFYQSFIEVEEKVIGGV